MNPATDTFIVVDLDNIEARALALLSAEQLASCNFIEMYGAKDVLLILPDPPRKISATGRAPSDPPPYQPYVDTSEPNTRQRRRAAERAARKAQRRKK